jgi:hypothetical protein
VNVASITTKATIVPIACDEITDWPSFHTVFAKAFGFPSFYGRNMNAWIDCLTDIGHPEGAGMTAFSLDIADVMIIGCMGYADLKKRNPELSCALIECSSIVNARRIAQGERPVIALMFTDPV